MAQEIICLYFCSAFQLDLTEFEIKEVSYKVVKTQTTFNEAVKNCKNLGGYLVTVVSNAMNGKLQQQLKRWYKSKIVVIYLNIIYLMTIVHILSFQGLVILKV